MPNPYDDFDNGPQRRQLTPADPMMKPKITRAQNEASASESAPAKAAAEARIAQLEATIKLIEANSAGAKNATDLAIAQTQLEKLRAELAATKTGKNTALDALQTQVDRVNELYANNIKPSQFPNVFNNIIPDFLQPNMGAFDTAGEGLANPFMSAFRVPGAGSQSDTELKQFLAANVPSQGDSNAQIEEKLRNIQNRIDAERGLDKSSALPAAGNPAQAEVGLAQGGTQSIVDPARKAIGYRVGEMISQGKSRAEIERYMRGAGVSPADTNLTEAIRYRSTPEFKAWQRANPGKPYPIGEDFYTKEVPMSETRQIVNKMSQSAPATAIMMAGNAVTGDRLANFSANPEMARAGMDLARAEHPYASLAGDMGGQALLEASVNRIPFARALTQGKWGRRGLDAAYGAYADSGDGDLGITGAFTNALGGGIGRRVQSKIGGAFTGVRDRDLQYLNDRNVPLTIGQIARAGDGVSNKLLAWSEDRLSGLPGTDAFINTARLRGKEGVNRAAFGEIGVNDIGSAGVEAGEDVVRNAYRYLDGATIPLDAQYAGTNAGIRAALPGLPEYGGKIGRSMDIVDKASPGGALSGKGWQDALRYARGNRASLRGKEFSDPAIDQLDDYEQNLLGLAQRQGPAGSADKLAEANALNMKFKTLTEALDNGGAQLGEEMFTPQRLDTAARAARRRFGGRTASMKGDRPFRDLTKAAMRVMPSDVPDSGTAGRWAMIPGLASLGAGAGALINGDDRVDGSTDGLKWGIGIGGALAGIYSKPGQAALQRAMLGPRSPIATKIGDYLIDKKGVGGKLGAALLRDLMIYPEIYPNQ